jgi:hypothetical protein
MLNAADVADVADVAGIKFTDSAVEAKFKHA